MKRPRAESLIAAGTGRSDGSCDFGFELALRLQAGGCLRGRAQPAVCMIAQALATAGQLASSGVWLPALCRPLRRCTPHLGPRRIRLRLRARLPTVRFLRQIRRIRVDVVVLRRAAEQQHQQGERPSVMSSCHAIAPF